MTTLRVNVNLSNDVEAVYFGHLNPFRFSKEMLQRSRDSFHTNEICIKDKKIRLKPRFHLKHFCKCFYELHLLKFDWSFVSRGNQSNLRTHLFPSKSTKSCGGTVV